MKQFKPLTYTEWFDTYKPIHVPYPADWNGQNYGNHFMFETYGIDLDFVRSNPNNHIWTYQDDGDMGYISSGYHLVNRLGYYITTKPFDASTVYKVQHEEE